MTVYFILVEPAVPENIGAASRAINTMGFSKLRLVNTNSHLEKEAGWLAHGSADILNNAQVYDSFDAAIQDLDFIIGTTAKNRSVKFDYYSPEESLSIVESKYDSIKTIGIVFGREESGLTNKELQQCDLAATIPIKNKYPSINLAQSVMIMAYVFSKCKLTTPNYENNQNHYALLKQKASQLLDKSGITMHSNLYGRIMERISIAKSSDINLFLSFISMLEKNILNRTE